MIGAALIVLAVVVLVPVLTLLAGAIAAVLLGESLWRDGDARHAGSELVDLNT